MKLLLPILLQVHDAATLHDYHGVIVVVLVPDTDEDSTLSRLGSDPFFWSALINGYADFGYTPILVVVASVAER